MAHILAPKPADPALPVVFNVDGVVGAAPAMNLIEDVFLVQFAFNMIGEFPGSATPPDVVQASQLVVVNGIVDDETIAAIQTMQESMKKTESAAQVVDGRVSPARGYRYGAPVWTIIRLNNALQNRSRGFWPRIDKIPSCPGQLKEMVARVLVGSNGM
jgi:hypothetical protein